MKQKKIYKKLAFSKELITQLTHREMKNGKGGYPTSPEICRTNRDNCPMTTDPGKPGTQG